MLQKHLLGERQSSSRSKMQPTYQLVAGYGSPKNIGHQITFSLTFITVLIPLAKALGPGRHFW
jgi:hypothetical protein